MERMSLTDHFCLLMSRELWPMNTGALLIFDVPRDQKATFADDLEAHLAESVPASVLARRLVEAPEHYDSDSWFGIAAAKSVKQIRRPTLSTVLSDEELRKYVIERNMTHLDPSVAAFEIDIIDQLEGAKCAVYFKIHHSLLDGIGIQMMLQSISDQGDGASRPFLNEDEVIPSDKEWLALAREKFQREEPLRDEEARKKAVAEVRLKEFLADPKHQRLRAPEMCFGSELSDQRLFGTLSFPVATFRAVGKALGATVNDLFIAMSAGALRSYLSARGQLPDAPLVTQCARSLRQADEGGHGNRVLALYPELATDEPDPVERLRRIQRSISVEKQRSIIEEDMQPIHADWPYGARDRRAMLASVAHIQDRLGSANIALSNAPIPDEHLSFAGYRLASNYAIGIIPPNRFLSIVTRRNGDMLDMGVLVDAAKLDDMDDLLQRCRDSFEDLLNAAAEILRQREPAVVAE